MELKCTVVPSDFDYQQNLEAPRWLTAELTVAAVVFVLLTDTCRTFGMMVLVYLLDFTGDWVYQISKKIIIRK